MTSQPSLALRPATASPGYPASEHDEHSGTQRAESGLKPGTADHRVILFLLDNPGQAWISEALSRAVAQRGQQSLAVRLTPGRGETADEAVAATLAHSPNPGTLRLLTTTSPAVAQTSRCNHIVLAVPANLSGIVTAYRRIKRLADTATPNLGVIVMGSRDQHSAWRYFRKLAVGTLRYLDIPLLNLGFLPARAADHQGDTGLARVGERLLHCKFHSQYRPDRPGTPEPATE